MIRALPSALQPLVNALVANAYDADHNGPPEAEPLYEWLLNEGWDDLIVDLDDGCAVNLDLLKTSFCDSTLWSEVGSEVAELTDDHRVAFIKEQVEWNQNDNSGDICPTFHAYPLVDNRGRTAVLGCVVEIHGQAGPEPYWQGVFKTRQDLVDFLHQKHIWTYAEVETLSDAYLLSLWKYDKPKSKRAIQFPKTKP